MKESERRTNLTEALARVGWSDALAAKLREEESQLSRLKAEGGAAARDARASPVPHPTAIAGYLKSLFGLLKSDPVRGREILTRFVAPVVMTPGLESPVRRYRATGAFNLSFIVSAAASGDALFGKSSCAGAICRFSDQQDREVAEVWVPFTVEVAIGWK